jgi:hypothetical protein
MGPEDILKNAQKYTIACSDILTSFSPDIVSFFSNALQTQFIIPYIIINFTQQICILEANSRTAGEEIPCLFDTGGIIVVF